VTTPSAHARGVYRAEERTPQRVRRQRADPASIAR